MRKQHKQHSGIGGRDSGFTLVELMIAMVVGLFLIAVVGSVFVANKQSYRANENLARIQEGIRVVNEMMSREIREAGGNLCGTPLVANVLNNKDSAWWADWNAGPIQGFDGNQDTAPKSFGTATADRVTGTDALIIRGAALLGGVVITQHNPAAAQFKVNTKNHGLSDDDIVMVCDYKTAAIFQVTNAQSGKNVTVVHNTGTAKPGNCSKGLGYPTICTTLGNQKKFLDGFLSRMTASFWYIGNNAQGGKSLFRMAVDGAPGSAGTPYEVLQDVVDMQLQYLTRAGTTLNNTYVGAGSISDWTDSATDLVVAVRVQLTMESADKNIGTDGNALQRLLLFATSMRNRELVQ